MARQIISLVVGFVLGGLITAFYFKHAEPRKWEYTVIWMASPGDTQPPYISDLTHMGEKGWRVVGALAGRGNGEGELILEREITH